LRCVAIPHPNSRAMRAKKIGIDSTIALMCAR
jgi:hypothetical protein